MFLHSRLQKQQGAGWGPGAGVEHVPGTCKADALHTITTETNPGTGVVGTCNPSTVHAEAEGLL